jgi:hypothetical protein
LHPGSNDSALIWCDRCFLNKMKRTKEQRIRRPLPNFVHINNSGSLPTRFAPAPGYHLRDSRGPRSGRQPFGAAKNQQVVQVFESRDKDNRRTNASISGPIVSWVGTRGKSSRQTDRNQRLTRPDCPSTARQVITGSHGHESARMFCCYAEPCA